MKRTSMILSISLIFVTGWQSPAEAKILVQPNDDCFGRDVWLALSEIAAAGMADMIADLDSSSKIISIVRDNNGGAYAFSWDEMATAEIITIGWDPNLGTKYAEGTFFVKPDGSRWPSFVSGRYPNDICIDAHAALAHELRHAYLFASGTNDTSPDPLNNNIGRNEIAAVDTENRYRSAQNLCLRNTYGTDVIVEVPTIFDPKGQCGPIARKQECRPRRSLCAQGQCCCWAHGGRGKTPTGGWLDCVKITSPEDCDSYNIPDVSNSACYGLELDACLHPDPMVPFCP